MNVMNNGTYDLAFVGLGALPRDSSDSKVALA